MTQNLEMDFILSIVDAYRAARVPVMQDERLSRGESRSIASEAEDRFAYYLVRKFAEIDHIFINQTITTVDEKPKIRIKPDLIICKGNEIRLLIDLKMDLGYKRDTFGESMQTVDLLVPNLRGREVSLWKKNGDTRTQFKKTVSKTARYVFVAISDQNINKEKFCTIEKGKNNCTNTGLFVLVRGGHPNDYRFTRDAMLENIKTHISGNDFNEIDKLIADAVGAT